MDARRWLVEFGYTDVAERIEYLMNVWKQEGKSTRRNWWDVLAGGRDGKPRVVGGEEFPVLRAAQIRQGRPVTSNAIVRDPTELKSGEITKSKRVAEH